MGCHTWFYKRVNRPIEEARKFAIEEIEKDRKAWQEIVDNDYKGFNCDDWRQWEKDGPGEGHIENWLKVLERQKRMIEKGLCNVAVYNRQPEISRFINGDFFVEEGTHDLFRIGGYPDDMLFSLEETLKYLEDKGDEIRYNSTKFDKTPREEAKAEAIERLKVFWDRNPDGMIKFG